MTLAATRSPSRSSSGSRGTAPSPRRSSPRARRSLAPRDRPLLRTIVRSVLRNRSLLDHVLSRSLSRPARRARPGRPRRAPRRGRAAPPPRPDPGARRRRARRSRPSARARRAPRGSSTPSCAASTRESEAAAGRPAARDRSGSRGSPLETSHPEWLVRRWVADLGPAAAEAALRADDVDAPVDVLLDPRGEDLERLRERLREEGLEGEPSPWAPLALTLSSSAAGSHPAIASGRLAVVDVAAQAMCELVEPADVVVDLAAAPGGKTRTLLARGKARRVVALERNPTRVAPARRRTPGGGGRAGRGPRRPRRLLAAAAAARGVSLRPPRRALLGDGDAPEEPGDPLAPLAGRPPGARPRPAARFSTPRSTSALRAGASSTSPARSSRRRTKGSSRPSCPSARTRRWALPAAPRSPRRSRLPCRPDGFFRVPPGASNDGFSAAVLRKAGGSR